VTAGPIVVLDYGMGNLGSISNMLKRLAVDHVVTDDPGHLADAAGIVLPGVGAFDRGMSQLAARGLRGALDEAVAGRLVPLLGICLGMQLLARGSEEGVEPGLGFVAADVVRFDAADVPHRRIPHMGWNRVAVTRPGLLPDDPDQRYYFVHSYAMACDDPADVVGTTTYGRPFVSAVQAGNVAGVQFHPEKSHRFGLEVLRRFSASTHAAV
jgi:imidazole glycerol-phosphate synthase subunit HisH